EASFMRGLRSPDAGERLKGGEWRGERLGDEHVREHALDAPTRAPPLEEAAGYRNPRRPRAHADHVREHALDAPTRAPPLEEAAGYRNPRRPRVEGAHVTRPRHDAPPLGRCMSHHARNGRAFADPALPNRRANEL